MNIQLTNIPEVVIVVPSMFEDDRGYFFEAWNQKEFDKKVRPVKFVQDNESKSTYGVLRGIHFQKGEHAQSKLVRVVKGMVLDVAVDLRVGSPTFGKYASAILSDANHEMLFIPRGFGHGFVVLSDEAVFQYKCDNFYNKESEGSVIWNDKTLNINWMINPNDVQLSDKDKSSKCLKEIKKEDLFDYDVNYY